METRPKHLVDLVEKVNERFNRIVGLEVEARKNPDMNKQLISAASVALTYFDKLENDSQQRVLALKISDNGAGVWQEHRFQTAVLRSAYSISKVILSEAKKRFKLYKEANHAKGN